MSTLYLIGNGFDAAHHIQTSYSAFRSFLEKEHEDFLTRFEAMYSIEPLDDTEPWYTLEAQQKWTESVIKDLWMEFEDGIGHPDVEGMHDWALSLVDGMPEDGIKDTLDLYWKEQYAFSNNLQRYVLEWLNTIDISDAKCRKDALINAQSDLFISFNYTDTLERIYGISNVLHIHGGLPNCSSIPPIMGHGNRSLIELYKRKAKDAQEAFIEWEESIDNAIANFCTSIYKDTDAIIARNEAFFSDISGVDQVVCLGLSFGDVDIPYLQRILQEIKPTTRWTVYYHGNKSHQRLKTVFNTLGINRKYETRFLQSDSFWDK